MPGKQVVFVFDERSMTTREELIERGVTFLEVAIRDPETGEGRVVLVPVIGRGVFGCGGRRGGSVRPETRFLRKNLVS
jgi:hypothetical protein